MVLRIWKVKIRNGEEGAAIRYIEQVYTSAQDVLFRDYGTHNRKCHKNVRKALPPCLRYLVTSDRNEGSQVNDRQVHSETPGIQVEMNSPCKTNTLTH